MAQNEIYLDGTVGASMWEEACFTAADVRQLLSGLSGPLTVHLNSGGGNATEGQAIYAMLKAYPGDVTVIVAGIAASAGSLIAMAGDRVLMTEGALLMIHDPAADFTAGRGTEEDHRKTAEVLAVVSNAYAGIYAQKAGITVEEARAIMQAETYFDAAGAVAAGFADEVAAPGDQKIAARFDYRIYEKAPSALRDGCAGMGAVPSREAVMAMLAGNPRITLQKEPSMAKDEEAAVASAGEVEAQSTDDTTATTATTEAVEASASQSMTMRERTRVRRLINMTEAAGLSMSLATDHIEKGTSEAAFVDVVLGQKVEKDVNHVNITSASVTKDARQKFIEGASKSLQMKAGLTGGERNEFSSMTLSELARHALALNGHRTSFADKRDMIGTAFTMDAGAMVVSDFSNVLANVMNKGALVGWEESDENFDVWTRKGTLPDFKATKRVGVGVFASLPVVPEGGNYTYGSISDRGEPISLATYGKLLRITRQSIINDDLTVLGDLPRRMGRAAKRTIGNLVYAILSGNPTMSDTVALFHATHGNLAGAAAAPSVATLGAAKAAMRVQSDNGSALNIVPKYFIVPAALEMTAKQLIGSSVDPTATKGMASNPVNNMAEVIVDARLDAASATAWFMAADPRAYDTIEVAYLDGNDTPYLEQMNAWTADGVEMKVRIDAGVSPLDYRTLFKNAG